MKCDHCGNDCYLDYFVIEVKRVINGYLRLPNAGPTGVYCRDCYKKIVDELNRKAKEL